MRILMPRINIYDVTIEERLEIIEQIRMNI